MVLKFERDLRKDSNPKPLLFVFELGKTPNVDKKSFVLVVNEFWGCVGLIFEEYCWLVLVWFGLEE